MHTIIEKVKNKAEELGVADVQETFMYGLSASKKTPSTQGIKDFQFEEYLRSLGFKVLDRDGGGEGGAERCHCVIELEGQPFRLDYSYYSYEGYYIDDIWDWTPVEAKQKTITVYE